MDKSKDGIPVSGHRHHRLGAHKRKPGSPSPTPGARYTGLAVATTLNQANLQAPFLYATDFHNGKIDVISASFAPATLAGNFTDSESPGGIRSFQYPDPRPASYLSPTQSKMQEARNPVQGAGNGFIDVYNLNGTPGLANSERSAHLEWSSERTMGHGCCSLDFRTIRGRSPCRQSWRWNNR